MDLFEPVIDRTANLLAHGGEVYYYGPILRADDADRYFDSLMTGIDWRRDTAIMFGRKITTKRKVAWYGDEPFQYAYSGVSRTALPWMPALAELKSLIETESGETYNSCLLNLYHDGSEGMDWHSDDEKDLEPNGAIASLSLGAERKFAMKPADGGESWSMMLAHGSLLIMAGATQDNWRHRLPTTKRVFGPRINLTFRTIVEGYRLTK